MRTFRKIGIGLLVGLFFTAGYVARLNVTLQEREAQVQARESVLMPGTRIAAANLEGAANVDFRPIETLYTVVKNLREHYVEQLTSKDEGRMTHDALRAMLASLSDPNTRFVDPKERRIIEDARQGKFHGIGVMLGIKPVKTGDFDEEHLIVIAPIATGPAAEAGLQPGDDIIEVNGKIVLPFDPFKRANKYLEDGRHGKTDRSELRRQLENEQKRIDGGIAIMEAQNLLLSEDGKPVELKIARPGTEEEIKIKLEPREFALGPVSSSIISNGHFGYIKINCFSDNVGDWFADAVGKVSAENVKGLVLDLRRCAGGDLQSVIAVAEQLAPGKRLGTVEKSRGRRTVINIPKASKPTWNKPLVVLVDSGTARTPELLAAALRENGVAKLVGQNTYGDSSFVSMIEHKDGSAILMTSGKFLTSRGLDFATKGVVPDKTVIRDGDDTQIDEAVNLLVDNKNRS